MRIIEKSTSFQINQGTAVTIGKFDGVHRGHQSLIQKVLEFKKKGLLAVVFTFDNAPNMVFGNGNSKELSTRSQKRKIFESMGIDVLIEYPLNGTTASIAPMEFVEKILLKQLNMKVIVAGKDISFGHKGAGNLQLLLEAEKTLGFQTEIVPKVCFQNNEISSTMVRNYISNGDMETAQELLGENYTIQGIVRYGNQLGRTFGMPTANIIPEDSQHLPPLGVYFSRVKQGDCQYNSLTNIGYKPTVTNEKVMGIETYLYDFQGDLYGQEIEVEIIKFLRSEKRFQDTSKLVLQLQEDLKSGKEFHKI